MRGAPTITRCGLSKLTRFPCAFLLSYAAMEPERILARPSGANLLDPERLAAVRLAASLQSDGMDELIERHVRLARRLLKASAAFVMLVDDATALIRSTAEGIELPQPVVLANWFCAYAVEAGQTLLVSDARADARFREHPVVRELALVAYAGVPLVVQEQVIGTFCVVDDKPREWDENDLEVLNNLAAAVAAEITLHNRAAPREQAEGVERDKQDNATRCSGVDADIAARGAAEALRASEEQLRLIAEALPVYIVRCDAELRYKFVNPAYAGRFGLEPEELVGKRLSDVIGVEAFQAAKPFLDRLLAGEAVQYEATIPYAGLGPRFMRSANVPERDQTGKVCGFIGVLIDLSDRKRAEDALKEEDRRKDEFLAILAHELRNPLAPVRNCLELMKRAGSDTDLMRRAHATMERQIGHMVRMIDDLLDVSRIGRNSLELRREQVSLQSVLVHSVEACRPLLEAARHDLEIRLPPDPVFLHADAVRLAQVFGNLLNNATRYTAPGGHIRLTAEREGKQVAVAVKDTGVGIPADMLLRVFDPFVQVDRSLERSQGGLGIGLSLVRQLVAMHDGTVVARSAGPGQGSEFVVQLPVVSAEHRPAIAPSSEEPTVTARRILIVDDNRDSADSLVMLLSLAGHETRAAYDGMEGIVVAQSFQPDVILFDLGMPKLNGFEACRQIRGEPWGSEITMLALSGWGQDEDRRKSREAGFDGHLVKPVDYPELLNLLASLPVRTQQRPSSFGG
jgi:PAS domain S-box-containing protein